MAILDMVARKLQDGILFKRRGEAVSVSSLFEVEETKFKEELPRDVKEGHFAVIAVNNGQPKRFVVPLRLLGVPAFKALLEQAAEEFGFAHKGALSIPCGCFEIEKILATQ